MSAVGATRMVQATKSSGGTVTSVSVTTANGFAGTVATATTTPAITVKTSITGILKGNGTAVSAATAGTDYLQTNVVSVTSIHTAANGETTLANGTFTVTGPPSVLNASATVVNSGSGVITWAAASGTIENAPTGAASSFTIAPGDSYSLVCDGANWWII